MAKSKSKVPKVAKSKSKVPKRKATMVRRRRCMGEIVDGRMVQVGMAA